MHATTPGPPLAPVGLVGRPGQVVVLGPQTSATSALEVVVDGRAVARTVHGSGGLVLETAEGPWRSRTTWRGGGRVRDAAGVELARAEPGFWRRAQRGHVDGLPVRWQPAGMVTRDGRWAGAADGAPLADVRVDGTWRHTVTVTFGPGARPGRAMLLLVVLTRRTVLARVPAGADLVTDVASSWS